MAFQLAAAVAGDANPAFLDVLKPSGPVAARAEFPKLVVARNASNVPTVNMFLDSDKGYGFAASVVDACGGLTTYAMRCTSAPRGASLADACGPTAGVRLILQQTEPTTVYGTNTASNQVDTLTIGPSTFRFSTAAVTRTAGYDVSVTVQEACDLQGTTQAVCSASVGGNVGRTTTATSATSTVAGTSYVRFDVAITGGAEKLANPTAQCKAPSSGASTKAVAVWGLVGVVGVASLLGF